MVRRLKDSTTEEEVVPDSPPAKKHRRHGKRKHKQRRFEDFESDSSIEISLEDVQPSDTMYQPKVPKMVREQPSTSAAQLLKQQAQTMRGGKEKSVPGPSGSSSPRSGRRKKGRGRDSGTSSEEERWLDAIKSGKLEEVDDELKKIKPKDPKMMTARQRAMYERGTDKDTGMGGEVLMALPSGYKQKVMTAESIQKAAIKSQKRKQMADEKREKDKKKTMERLLKKQESKNLKNAQKFKVVRKIEPMIIYKNNANEITLSLPVGVPFPLEQKGPIEAPKPVICVIEGCFNIKKYNCSTTNVPLCSLECYKKNLHSVFS